MTKAFSIQTITALTEVVSGGSAGDSTPSVGLYRSGPRLERFFGGLNIELRIGNASRVPTVQDALTRENSKPGGREVMIKVLEAATDPRDYLNDPTKLDAVVEYMNKRLSFDGVELRRIGQLYRVVALGTNSLAATALQEKAASLRLESAKEDFDRAIAETESDPADAITSACATVESVCKCILEELGKPYPPKQDIQHLSNAVAEHLGLSPARTDLPPALAQDLRQILGGLQSVAAGIGTLRTHFGDAHGRGKARAPVDARIARLAIHAACTLSLFYIETWRRMAEKTTRT